MRIAMLGLGFMGSTHLRAMKAIPQAELAAVASDVPQQLSGDLSGIQGNIGGPGETYDFSRLRKYSDLFEAAGDPGAEAVDVCLPTHLHKPVVLAALQAGKHVLVEKPMALNGEECDAMIAAAEKAGRVLMVAQVVRFWPSYVVLRDVLRSGRLGAVRSASFRRRCAAPTWQRWVYDKSISGGGVFDLVIHDADMCLQLFGTPQAVSAVGCEDMPKGIDTIAAQLHYSGIPAVTISGGWHHPASFPFSMEFTVVADGGTLEFSSAGRPLTLYRADGVAEELPVPELDAYQAEIEYFVDCCTRGRKPELCPPEDSSLAVKLTMFMTEARSHNGGKIPFKL